MLRFIPSEIWDGTASTEQEEVIKKRNIQKTKCFWELNYVIVEKTHLIEEIEGKAKESKERMKDGR